MLFSSEPALQAAAAQYSQKPPKGTPESVPVPNSELPGRSKVYRHWKVGNKELPKTLDPKVSHTQIYTLLHLESLAYFLCSTKKRLFTIMRHVLTCFSFQQ